MGNKPLIANIKNQLLTRMQNKNLNPYALEDIAGLARGSARNIVFDKSKNPGIEIISALAEALECKVDDLLQDEKSTALPGENCEIIEPLFSDIIDFIFSYCKKKNLKPHLQDLISLIDKAYSFSFTKHNKKLASEFIEWLIDNSIKPK